MVFIVRLFLYSSWLQNPCMLANAIHISFKIVFHRRLRYVTEYSPRNRLLKADRVILFDSRARTSP